MSIKGYFVLHANRPYMRDTIMLEMMDKSEGKVESHTKFAELINTEGAYSPVAFVYNIDNIGKTFELTNHIDKAWTENSENVTELLKGVGKRSTSVGDIVLDAEKETIYVVSSFGFTELNNKDVDTKKLIKNLVDMTKSQKPKASNDLNI